MSRSTFPQRVDTFTDAFDLPANLVSAALELQKLKQKTILDNNDQNRIQALTAQLQDYMITPERINRIQDCINALETFFDENVRQYILGKQKEWDQYVNDFVYKGNWSATSKYKRQNIVTYNGNLYIVIKDVVADNAHNPNVDADHYRQCAYKGDKGDIGLTAIYKGEWSGSTQYKTSDAVSIRLGAPWDPIDMVFIAKQDNQGQKPTMDRVSDYWFPYHQLMSGETNPTSLQLHPDVSYIQFWND